jgi:hypothetical protein
MTRAAIQALNRFGVIPPKHALILFFQPVTIRLRLAASALTICRATSSLLMLNASGEVRGVSPARLENAVAVGPGQTARVLTPLPLSS